MMTAFGNATLLGALLLCGYQFVAGTLALYGDRPSEKAFPIWLAPSIRVASACSFLAMSAALCTLVWASLSNDFSLAYIVQHSNRHLPAIYKFAALWSGQEGSLLLWAWLLSGYTSLLYVRRSATPRLSNCASAVMAGIQIFFLLLLNIPARPFTRVVGPIPSDGFGLNPLLQYPEMVAHPPMLYLGYVGFSVPFAFALSALVLREGDDAWIPVTRQWMMLAWVFLTCGICMGSHWAYAVLGWGGYWGWDPVENASLMPWLSATAFLHASLMYEKRGMMKRWSVWLIFASFMLSILGTLLTRSGILSSVHSFAQSSLGTWFWSFLVLVMSACVVVYIRRRDQLTSKRPMGSFASRESGLLFNNVLLLATCFVILWGTLLPVLTEHVLGNRLYLGPPFFNGAIIPAGLMLLALMGLAPLLPWRKGSREVIRQKLLLPAVVGIVTAACLAALRPWSFEENRSRWIACATWALALTVASSIVNEFLRGVLAFHRQSGRTIQQSVMYHMSANLPRYGSYVAHLGIVVLFAGIAGSAWNQSRELEFTLHQSVVVGPYRVECSGYTHQSGLNYDSDYVLLDVYRGHQKVSHLVPERRVYIASGQPMTVVANYSKLSSDLYIIYAGKEPDTQHPILKVFLNPLVQWVWIGMGVVIFGGIISLFSARDNVRTTRASHLTSIIRYRAMEVFPAEESCPSVVERDASPSVFAAQEGE